MKLEERELPGRPKNFGVIRELCRENRTKHFATLEVKRYGADFGKQAGCSDSAGTFGSINRQPSGKRSACRSEGGKKNFNFAGRLGEVCSQPGEEGGMK